jgi:hypothetical protein
MKYLKKYESLDSSKSERNLEFLRDMSLELGDDGFNVFFSCPNPGQLGSDLKRYSGDHDDIKVLIQKSRGRFDYNDIKSTLLSMISYMESEGYSIGSIEVSGEYVSNLIPVKLKGEELYLEFRPEEKVDYPIGQLLIKFR